MTMTSCECEIRINNLPDEVLCIIFDHLDIESVKRVSSTCQRWNNIVFYSAYVRRFMFNIDIPSPKMLFKSYKQRKKTVDSLVEKLMHTAKHTKRKYRNLRIVINVDVIDSFQSIWEIIHPKVTATTNSLQLVFKLFTDSHIITLVTEAIEEMPNLRSLWLKSSGFVSLHQDVIPTMRSTTVEHLRLEAARFVVDMPRLRSFKGFLFSLIRPLDSPHPLVLAKLRQVKLRGNTSQLNVSSIIRRMRLVDSMEFSSQLNDSFFITICDICTSLKELHFQNELQLFDPRILDHLSRLINLRRLTFKYIRPMRDYALNIDLQKLTQLEQLDLGFPTAHAVSLLKFPNTIRTLSLSIGYNNERNIIDNTISSLDQLTDLCLCSGENQWRPSLETFQALSHLKKLRVLQFCCCPITVEFFSGMQAPMYQVRKLILLQRYIESNTLSMARIKFPNANIVKISNKR
ncbi:uncharacterized protein LOC118462645 [Anopheles albimanus]|uniref:uncharacterized protein LOC118462645 n=1 Tax=Anopheles albimanus TaxID=7167 RepID=UPI00163EDC92|nr:uncharacterized protein LOC118462645 [Anopheles albimanus]